MSRIRMFEGEPPYPLNMCWECPVCGAQVGQADSPTAIVKLHPPMCSLGHSKTEMEQRSAERWGRQFEEGDHGEF